MELQFHKQDIVCMQLLAHQVQHQEQTQELKLTEQMPDVGKVLGTWGQVLLRGKEWNSGEVQMSGGVMVWVLYQPEDGSAPQHLEGWVPFQMKWEIPHTSRDGVVHFCPLLHSIDARSVSARKLMVRCNLGVCAKAYVQQQTPVYTPRELPQQLQLLQREYPMLLTKEAGEKPFDLEEELSLPSACPAMASPVCYWVRPELIDKKVMGDKAVFRGSLGVHLLYMGQDGRLHSWEFDAPYSQYTELEGQYGQEADIDMHLVPTAVELELDAEGKLQLKAGVTGQYVIYDTEVITVVEDAYCIDRPMEAQIHTLDLPAVLERKMQTLTLKQSMAVDGEPVDAVILPAQPHILPVASGVEAELNCGVQVLYYDDAGMLQSTYRRFEDVLQLPCGETADVHMCVHPTGKPQAYIAGDGLQVTAELLVQSQAFAGQGMDTIAAVQFGEPVSPDPHRPSIILQRVNEGGLWELAKKTGSTVSAIRMANNLVDEPQTGEMVLIPVL